MVKLMNESYTQRYLHAMGMLVLILARMKSYCGNIKIVCILSKNSVHLNPEERKVDGTHIIIKGDENNCMITVDDCGYFDCFEKDEDIDVSKITSVINANPEDLLPLKGHWIKVRW